LLVSLLFDEIAEST